MIDDLLKIADDLANRDSGRPRHASLRRAVATAYYALFHAVSERCSATLVTFGGSDWETYALVYRAFDHAKLEKVFKEKTSREYLGPQIAGIGDAFLQLQVARIAADYDPKPFSYGKSEILQLIEQARSASQQMRDLPEKDSRRLAALLIGKRR